MRRVANSPNVKKFVEELIHMIESSPNVIYVSDVHERIDGRWAFTIAGKNRRISVIIDDSKDEAIMSPIYYDDELPVTDEVSAPIDFSDIDYSCNSILDVAREFDFPTSSDLKASKKQASNHRLARGFHSRWNESDMYDFVDDAVDEINRHTYSDIMAGNFSSYEGDDGEVYTFDIMSDYFTLYVEVDGTNVSISCEDDPSLDQAWDFDEDYSSSNLADDLFSIASDAEEVFIEMSEEEASEGFVF